MQFSSDEYKEVKKLTQFISGIIFLVIFYDIFVHGAKDVIIFSFIKLIFIASFFIPIQLLKYPKLKDYAPVGSMLLYFYYAHYYMLTLHYSYYTAYIEFFMVGPLILRFKRIHFLTTYILGLALLIWGTLQLQGSTGDQSYTEDVLQTTIPVWLFSIFWYFSITKMRDKIANQEKKFAELGKTSSFLLHEIQAPLSRLNSNQQDENQRKKELIKINNIINISQAISAKKIENIKYQDFRIKDQVADVLENYEQAIKLSGIELNITLDDIELYTSKELFLILIKNLLINAIEYLNEKSEIDRKLITISGNKVNDNYILNISNSFSSNASSDLIKMFEPLYSTKQGVQTRGLGLFICKKIATILDFRITNERDEDEILFRCFFKLK